MRLVVWTMCIFVVALPATAQEKKSDPKTVSGMTQDIPLRFFLEPRLKELERKMKNKPSPGDVASYWFLKELLKESSRVLLSASSVIDDKGLRIERLCEPSTLGATGFTYKLPDAGWFYGELTVKWEGVRIIRAFKDKKDLAHARLVFEIRITRDDKLVTAFSMTTRERFVIFDQKANPDRVYVFGKNDEIVSVSVSPQ